MRKHNVYKQLSYVYTKYQVMLRSADVCMKRQVMLGSAADVCMKYQL